jgi:hypothetical protein
LVVPAGTKIASAAHLTKQIVKNYHFVWLNLDFTRFFAIICIELPV